MGRDRSDPIGNRAPSPKAERCCRAPSRSLYAGLGLLGVDHPSRAHARSPTLQLRNPKNAAQKSQSSKLMAMRPPAAPTGAGGSLPARRLTCLAIARQIFVSSRLDGGKLGGAFDGRLGQSANIIAIRQGHEPQPANGVSHQLQQRLHWQRRKPRSGRHPAHWRRSAVASLRGSGPLPSSFCPRT